MKYKKKNILVLGAGKSGIAVCKLLANKGNNIVLSEINQVDDKTLDLLDSLEVETYLTNNQVAMLDFCKWDLIIKNPAIMSTSEVMREAKRKHLRVENELEVAFHFLPKDITIIGVTGSNGKTTTVTLIYEFLKRSGNKVVLGGNIGTPLCDLVRDVNSGDILLLELSDHQLCDMYDFKTDISVITNICPTHLDYHGNYEEYKKAKAKIFNKHTKKELAIINKSNKDTTELVKGIKSKIVYFNDDVNYYEDGVIYLDNKKVLDTKDIKLKGNHNYENILASLLVCSNFKMDIDNIKEFLRDFGGVEHRLEYVDKIKGVEYYNDSKSTNPTATITALKTFDKNVHLILGGLDRNLGYDELEDYLEPVKYIYAIGETAQVVVEFAKKHDIPVYKGNTLSKTMNFLKTNVEPGDVVLLSPASSSQDQYPHFEDRGREFKRIVKRFK